MLVDIIVTVIVTLWLREDLALCGMGQSSVLIVSEHQVSTLPSWETLLSEQQNHTDQIYCIH